MLELTIKRPMNNNMRSKSDNFRYLEMEMIWLYA